MGALVWVDAWQVRSFAGRPFAVPGSVTTCPVSEADGWEPEEGARHLAGYLVTLTDSETLG